MNAPLSYSTTTLGNDDTMFYARQLMVIPDAGKACREAQLLLPLMEIQSTNTPGGFCTPTVVVTIDCQGGGGATDMNVYKLTVEALGAQTQIGVAAQTVGNTAVDYDYFCNFTVIGTVVAQLSEE